MSEPTLEQVKGLAERLSSQDRLELFYRLAELPDSGIRPTEVYEPPAEIQAWYAEALKESEERDYFGIFYDDRNVIVILKGQVIFELLFYPENFNEAWLKIPSWQHAPLPEAAIKQAREHFAELGREVSDEELMEAGRHAIAETYKDETFRISRELSVRLPELVQLFLDGAIKIIQIDVRNSIVTEAGLQSGQPKLPEIEKMLEPHWKAIKERLLGVTRGGKRPRKSKFTWDAAKALEFYRTVEALPHHGADKLPMWEYAQEMLRDNDYDHETIMFLMNRPMFADVPEGLLREATSAWRQHEESWDSLPPDKKPQAFAFRHACHKLDFPEYAYNTLRMKYYEGKKAFESGK